MSAVGEFTLPRFCTVCGEWFDQALTTSHCARPKVIIPSVPSTLPYGDFGTVWQELARTPKGGGR